MTSAEPPTEVAPAIVPHQPPSLKDLSSSSPTSVTPPISHSSPPSGSPQAARPVGASVAAGALPSGSSDGLSPPSPPHAAMISIRMASTAIIELGCFRICFLHTIRRCAQPRDLAAPPVALWGQGHLAQNQRIILPRQSQAQYARATIGRRATP